MVPVSGICFYCSNPTAPNQRVIARIEHQYKNGTTRDSVRSFHPSCLDKFKIQGGRPFNPATNYEVLEEEHAEA
jgi:hypothetical protein